MRSPLTSRWFALSVAALGAGGAFAFLVGMSRMPMASKHLPPDYFQHALAGHVNLAILCWLLISAVVLWGRFMESSGWWGGVSFRLAAGGVALIAVSSAGGFGTAVLNNYVPTIIHPLFFLGLGIFFLAFCMNVFGYIGEGIKGVGSGDMVQNALSAALFIGVVMMAAVAASLALLGGGDFQPQVYYERLFWTPGHIQQILNGAMLVAVWYALAEISAGKKTENMPGLNVFNKMLIASAVALLGLMFVFDPLDKPMRVGSEIVYAVGLGVPLFAHIFNIMRRYKFRADSPASVALLFSVAIYLFGIFIAYAGFSNDTRVPAHYHGAVTALTLALMAFGYHMMAEGGATVSFDRVARIQPYIYGVGMTLFIAGLFVSGVFGAPRKTFGVAWTQNPVVLASMTLMGIGTLLAVAGGALFVLYAGVTLAKRGLNVR